MLDKLLYENAIGTGSFAEVFRYVDESGVKYGVKKLKKELKDKESEVKRFVREIEMLKALKGQPNIVPILDYNKEKMYYIMPYAEQNLYKYIIKNNDILDLDSRIDIFVKIIDGISIAHSKNILHRDLTPNNILKIENDWYICDFGLGKDYSLHTNGGYSSVQGYGSFNYAAPEQIDKLKDATIQSDVYSLGKILYFIVTGREPRIISDAGLYKNIIIGAASEKIEDRYESVSLLKSELLKRRELLSRFSSLSIDQVSVREYLDDRKKIDINELFEVVIKNNVYDHVYDDFLEPITTYFDNISKISTFTSNIGQSRTLEFIELYITNLHNCYATVGWPFNALNSFGYFLNRFYQSVVEYPDCQLLCLKEMWNIAANHDQWAIQELIVDIISSNQIRANIREEFALYIVEQDKHFDKLDRINLSRLSPGPLSRAIRVVRK